MKELLCADYNAIEVRMLFWVANHADGIAAFRDDRPIYEEMASAVLGRKITRQDPERDSIGKPTVLGCGFGMGPDKFLLTCHTKGNMITAELAIAAVKVYRDLHSPVVTFWYDTENAAIKAVKNPGKRITVGTTVTTTWFTEGDFLYVELPSKRRIAFPFPEIKLKPTPWGEDRATLYHYSVNPKTRAWESVGTYGGRLVENIVQGIARDLMAEALIRLEEKHYEIVLHSHDEVIGEREKGKGSVREFESLMATLPLWARGCPVKAAGWSGQRYRK